jgi:hypothetical protein
MKDGPRLQTLDLRDKGIGAAGAAVIAGSLKDVPQLQRLDLSWNDIGAVGAAAVPEVFRFVTL